MRTHNIKVNREDSGGRQMSAARKCDRCGKLFSPSIKYNGLNNVHHDIEIRKINNTTILCKEKEIDVCPECYDSFATWLEVGMVSEKTD